MRRLTALCAALALLPLLAFAAPALTATAVAADKAASDDAAPAGKADVRDAPPAGKTDAGGTTPAEEAATGDAAATRDDAERLPPPPPRHFYDAVGLVSPEQAEGFADELYGFEQRTKIQFVVAVLPDLGGDIETYVNRLYERWRIGNKETNRGVLFAIFPRQRASRIEVGYGLEDSLPDVVASRIIRRMQEIPADPAAPRFAYVIRTVAKAIAPDDPLARGAQVPRRAGRHGGGWGLGAIIGFLIFALLAGRGRSNMLGPILIASALSSRRGGGGGGGFFGGGGFGGGGFGGGGGGFAGGGGFSGGGGASGGW